METSVLLCVLLLGIYAVCVQGITMEANLGGTVILPCSVVGDETDVFWRYEQIKTVYDVILGKENLVDQDPVFRYRVKGFPSEFNLRNYSIKLSDLKATDSGNYTCRTPSSNMPTIELKIKETKAGQRNSGTMRGAHGLLLFPLVCFLLCGLSA